MPVHVSGVPDFLEHVQNVAFSHADLPEESTHGQELLLHGFPQIPGSEALDVILRLSQEAHQFRRGLPCGLGDVEHGGSNAVDALRG